MILHLRCLLLCFQVVFGSNINLKKFEMVCIGDRRDETKLVETLSCKCINLSIKYLGLPLRSKFKDGRVLKPVIDMFERRLAGWKSRFSSKGGRLI